jgi:hypothetical protein
MHERSALRSVATVNTSSNRQQHGRCAGIAHTQVLEALLDVVDGDGASERALPDAPIMEPFDHRARLSRRS